jgi:hypothetical protein
MLRLRKIDFLSVDPAIKYCVGAPSISALFAEMGGKQSHFLLAGSIVRSVQRTQLRLKCFYDFPFVFSAPNEVASAR